MRESLEHPHEAVKEVSDSAWLTAATRPDTSLPMALHRALLSVSDKRGLEAFARGLVAHGAKLLSTGGTADALARAGIAVEQVSAYTGAPEILDGRVKTLHPKVHGGLLGRDVPAHQAEMRTHGIEPIDLVCVNLYPFAQVIAKPNTTLEEAIENIDIGGPSMLRSGAKNFERVTVVVDPDDYARVLEELDKSGEVSRATRFALAQKAFAHTAAYDARIATWLAARTDAAGAAFPDVLVRGFKKRQALRYGENPHQQAAFYVEEGATPQTLAGARVLGGKELSYNNILDLDAARGLIRDFDEPACAIIKHNNPCGVGESPAGVGEAFALAKACDPTSAFGGIVAVNREVDTDLAQALSEMFLECVLAPAFSAPARALLEKKKNLRLLEVEMPKAKDAALASVLALRSVSGGLLVQTQDVHAADVKAAPCPTKRKPTADELRALDFAWRVAGHVKSNAIVLARPGQTVGIGAGQMSRIDAVRLAGVKAQMPTQGSVLASDAFFPFRDNVDEAAKLGVTAIVQPGGSVRDEECIAAADEHQIAMVMLGVRRFRH